jgi:hypothetical protein
MQAACPSRYPSGMGNPLLKWVLGIAATLAVVFAAVLAAGAIQKRVQQRHIAETVRDTTEKLRQGLAAKPAPELLAAIDANLKMARAPRDPAFAEAAESYIVSAREIVRRRGDIERLERQAQASRQALAGHMAGAARRNEAWMHGALALKKRVESDYFDLNVTFKALEELLFKLPESTTRLEPRVGSGALLEASQIASARKQIQDEARRANEELAKLRRIGP